MIGFIKKTLLIHSLVATLLQVQWLHIKPLEVKLNGLFLLIVYRSSVRLFRRNGGSFVTRVVAYWERIRLTCPSGVVMITSANALFWASLLTGFGASFASFTWALPVLILFIFIFSYLLVSEIPMLH